ncbi:orotate phosphoribosyltransferase [Phosphitispora fastidiosa]|uniref:orotate phosphoribosyltransferase n=1 Tax=Phosphitispora fastidiosa TaxID=2837202 RepID=UPI001E590B99|nr:orotate phosphoribosyltransferase [Phosphitispora fastidiosa]MBU7008460.1 orotate phosphoribosyltransferase [Phosphitispora fastidiosa]
MLTEEQAIEIFTKSKALLTGHFRLTSGRHSSQYMQCAQVLQYPEYASRLCRDLAERFAGVKVDTVIGPALGGIIVAYEVGRAMGVRTIFTEREQGVMSLRRGFVIEPGEKVLVVEDVVTTGGSVKEVIEVVRQKGGEVVGVGVLVNRSNGKVDFGVKAEAVLSMEIQSYDPEDCPLCREGLPVIKPGSRQV